MRTTYRVLAWLVAAGVVIQAMSIVYAVAGLGKWIEGGGVFDRSVLESEDASFSGARGFMVHGLNGSMVIPALALLLLVCSFFASVAGGVRWALAVLALVVVQATLGFLGHEIPAVGALHGLNALLLLATAVHTARRAAPVRATPQPADAVTTAA